MPSSRRPLTTPARLLSLTAAAVVVAVLLATASSGQVFRATGSSAGAAAPRGSSQFGIRVGSVKGLHPGGDVEVRVRYTNPFGHGLVVGSQRIRVTSPSPDCPPATVDLSRALSVLTRPLVVPARSSRTLRVVLAMRATAPDGCQGVRFTTSIDAQGRKQ